MLRLVFRTSIAILLFLSFGSSCDKEKMESEDECNYVVKGNSPENLIIGRWKLYKIDNRLVDINNLADVEYREFSLDSVSKLQYYLDGKLVTSNQKYWIDSLLHYYHPDGYPYTPWHYDFTDFCTFKLDNAFLSLTPISLIYKRTEQKK